MRILVVDDDENKLRHMLALLKDSFQDYEVEDRRSYQSGMKALLTNPPDLLVLDMTMPTFDIGGREKGGRERRYAGQEILEEMDRKEIAVPVIIVTQFEQFGQGDDRVTLQELRVQLAASYPGHYVAIIYYQAANSKWMYELTAAIAKVRATLK